MARSDGARRLIERRRRGLRGEFTHHPRLILHAALPAVILLFRRCVSIRRVLPEWLQASPRWRLRRREDGSWFYDGRAGIRNLDWFPWELRMELGIHGAWFEIAKDGRLINIS